MSQDCILEMRNHPIIAHVFLKHVILKTEISHIKICITKIVNTKEISVKHYIRIKANKKSDKINNRQTVHKHDNKNHP